VVPGAFQQFPLLVEDNVFSSGLLVSVVGEEDLHFSSVRLSIGGLQACFRAGKSTARRWWGVEEGFPPARIPRRQVSMSISWFRLPVYSAS
jgi:hypothetical protein